MEALITQSQTYLVRFGAISEVVFVQSELSEVLERGTQVVIESQRGPELAQVLELKKSTSEPESETGGGFPILRVATSEDLENFAQLQAQAKADFPAWTDRIKTWKIDLQLIDLEWTLGRERLVLYVLNQRGPDCTKLALQATAAGFGSVDVQPVSLEGLVHLPVEKKGGGCGSGGCGSH